MSGHAPGEVTRLLAEIRAGNPTAQEQLFQVVYEQLHQMAAGFAAAEWKAPALQASSLLDDACVQILEDNLLLKAPNRAYFFGAMAIAMRRILAQHARQRQTLKRGSGLQRIPLDSLLDHYEERRIDLIELNDALERLSQVHERASQVITLRVLGGCTAREVAGQLDVSLTTVEKDTRFARAWLRRQLGGNSKHVV